MRPVSWLLILSLAIVLAVPPVRADETEDLAAAQKVLDAAPAYRTTLVTSSSMGPGTNRATFEFQRPDLVHAKFEIEGQPAFEAYTDGEKTLSSETGGIFKDAPPALVTQMAASRHQLMIVSDKGGDFAHKVSHLTFSGHETVNGVASSCYKGETDNAGTPVMSDMHNSVKIWISDQDHRPVRAEWSMRGKMQMDPHADPKPMSQDVQVTYDLDPAIKIVLPTVG